MSEFIITGAAGFIGAKLVQKLKPLNVVFGFDSRFGDAQFGNDLTKPFTKPFIWNDPQTVFHLAGCSDVHGNRFDCLRTNVLSTFNVLEAFVDTPTRLVFASTYLRNGSAYALSKRSCEDAIVASGISHRIVRCCNVFGPGDYNTNRIIPSLITKMLNNDPVDISECKRDFVYIDDVVDAYMKLSYVDSDSTIFGISGTGCISLTEVANKLKSMIGSSSKVNAIGRAKNAQKHDCEDLRSLGWKPERQFDGGLQATIDWWKEQLKCD